MQTVRTTVTFPEDLHRELIIEAITSKKSLSDVVVEKVVKQTAEETDSPKKRVGRVQKTPYGMFKGANVTEEDIEEVIKSWDKIVDELA